MTSQAAPLQDHAAFSQLFARTHLAVFRFIFGLLGGSSQDAEDLTGDTFTRAWKARHTFQGDEQAALGWLFTIARHLVIDNLRRRKSRGGEPAPLPEEILDLYLVQPESTPEEAMLAREQFRVLWKLMQDLPADRREMLVLRYMLGWPVKNIAGYLNMPENTISVYLRRSVGQIRDSWPVDEQV